jgi:hypothetical protein
VPTNSAGAFDFVLVATDHVGNRSESRVSYSVAYRTCELYDPTRGHKSGSTVPIKLQLCDAAGVNRSAPAVTLSAVNLQQISAAAGVAVEDSGNANADGNFRYDASLQGYIFNLSTQGLSIGTWELQFRASGDSTLHTARFVIGR